MASNEEDGDTASRAESRIARLVQRVRITGDTRDRICAIELYRNFYIAGNVPIELRDNANRGCG